MTLQEVAIHARNVENRLRRDFKQFGPIIEIELGEDGFVVKSVAGDDEKSFSHRCVVPYDCEDCLAESVNEAEHIMRNKMSKPTS